MSYSLQMAFSVCNTFIKSITFMQESTWNAQKDPGVRILLYEQHIASSLARAMPILQHGNIRKTTFVKKFYRPENEELVSLLLMADFCSLEENKAKPWAALGTSVFKILHNKEATEPREVCPVCFSRTTLHPFLIN